MSISFASDLFPWVPAATLLLLAILMALDFTRRRRLLERIGNVPQLQRMMASLSQRGRVVKAVLAVAAVSLIVTALMRPQLEGESSWRKRGIDVVLVLDFSKSMYARDVENKPRFEVMTKEVEDLLAELESDRVAVVVFAGAAAHFPLTHDHDAAMSLFRGLQPVDMPPGSDIGEAVLTARCIVRPDLLGDPGCARVGGRGRGGAPLDARADPRGPGAPEPEVKDRARAVVVFTDGEDTESQARAEVDFAVRLGINVFVVGVGTVSGELIPEFDRDGKEIGWKKTEDGKSFVTTRLDQAHLKELAEIAGGEEGHYFQLAAKRLGTDELSESLRPLLTQLQRLKKGDLDDRVKREWKDAYQWLLFPAFMLLILEACISGRRRRMLYPEERE